MNRSHETIAQIYDEAQKEVKELEAKQVQLQAALEYCLRLMVTSPGEYPKSEDFFGACTPQEAQTLASFYHLSQGISEPPTWRDLWQMFHRMRPGEWE